MAHNSTRRDLPQDQHMVARQTRKEPDEAPSRNLNRQGVATLAAQTIW
eukprot:CAMPEP_0181172588 /NCGR_PEP_ID=MMETSP1096-20121128/2528_1 /TAXON_ID=156174 ORGANISM="Chrysochromulina ericina, Strain CCMP281" /NCGR_SAMPLE_ID=MMETSP1096 /ASSEMBLY_ACC=CAM_ASM_000453 /LENGTH=47 /DNA_ID= /DNA_START= /DNA_END= /DNA_ORIENTATION=